jgi:glycosyltransferase involved in cell wall biosynthesis
MASELKSITAKEIYSASLPKKLPLTGPLGSDVKLLSESMHSSMLPVVLSIGRQRKYKGVDAFLKLAREFQDTALFVIAGEGSINDSKNSKVVVVNRWLSNREFMQVIDNSDILFFSYSEASQSGNIPLAMSKNKIIVATSQPGLTEQLTNYPLKVIYDSSDAGNISLAFAKALAMHANEHKIDDETIPDRMISLYKVVEAIEFNLEKRE